MEALDNYFVLALTGGPDPWTESWLVPYRVILEWMHSRSMPGRVMAFSY